MALLSARPAFNGSHVFIVSLIFIYSSVEMSRFGLGNLQFLVKAACSAVLLQSFAYQLLFMGAIKTFGRAWFPIMYLFLCYVSLFWSVSFEKSTVSLVGAFIIFLGFLFLNNSCDRLQIIEAVFYSCLIYLALNIFLYPVFGDNFYDFLQGTYRFSGITYGAHSIARIALFLFISSLALLYEGRLSRIAFMGILIFIIPFLVLSDSRQAYIAIFGVAMAYVLLRSHRALLINLILVASILIFLGLLFLLVVPSLESLTRTGNVDELMSVTGRLYIWQTAVGLIIENPYLGYGFGSAQTVIQENYSTEFGWTTGSAHNGFLHMALEMGLVFAVLFHFFLFFLAVKNFKEKNLFNTSVLITLILLGLVEKSYAGNADFLFLFLLIVSSELQSENTPHTLSVST